MPKKETDSSQATASALECPVHFLSEQRTELYKRYCSGVAQLKNVLGAHSSLSLRASALSSAESAHPSESKTKNGFIKRALLGLERRGA